MQTLSSWALILCGCLVLAACSSGGGLRINSSYDHRIDFSSIKTYHWGQSSLERLYRNEISSDELDLQVKQGIARRLADRGLREAAPHEAVDTNVSYQLTSRNSSSQKMEGMLAITFYDPSGQRSIWRGVGQTDLSEEQMSAENYRSLLALIDEAIEEILKTFPPQE